MSPLFLALALCGQPVNLPAPLILSNSASASVPSIDAIDQWTMFEYLGHYEVKDGTRKFVYTKARARAANSGENTRAGAVDFGMTLADHLSTEKKGIRGNDLGLTRILAEAIGPAPAPAPGNASNGLAPSNAPKLIQDNAKPCPGPGPCKPDQPREPEMPFRNPFVPEETHFQRWLPFYAAVTVLVLGGFTMLFCGGIAYLVFRKQPLQ